MPDALRMRPGAGRPVGPPYGRRVGVPGVAPAGTEDASLPADAAQLRASYDWESSQEAGPAHVRARVRGYRARQQARREAALREGLA